MMAPLVLPEPTVASMEIWTRHERVMIKYIQISPGIPD